MAREPQGKRARRAAPGEPRAEPIPKEMRALRKTRAASGAELAEIAAPQPGPGDVLVRVDAASVCGTDLHIYRWDEWAAGRLTRLPITFGHEVAGTVVATGPGEERIDLGAFVSVETHLFCGRCAMCRTGRAHICENLRILGVDVDGAFAEFVSVPAKNCWIVDPRIPPDVASIQEPFGNAAHTAFVSDGGAEIATATVTVLGCGPIGLFAVGIARATGARQVLAVEPNPFRQNIAKQMGADAVIDPSAADPVQAVMEATDGHGAEVVFEMSGVASVIDQATRMVAHGGRIALLGLPSGPVQLDLTDQVIFKEARIYGVTGRELFRTWRQTTTLLATGMVDVAPVITHRFALSDFHEAFETAASGKAGKVILLPGDRSGGREQLR